MSSAARIADDRTYRAPGALTAIAQAEVALGELFRRCERLHESNIEHDPHSCFLCFESR